MVDFCNSSGCKAIITDRDDCYEVTEYAEPGVDEKWQSVKLSRRTDEKFLCENLRYRFLNDDVKGHLDLEKPIFEIKEVEILTCDERLERILFYTYDSAQEEKVKVYTEARKRAKENMRRVCGKIK